MLGSSRLLKSPGKVVYLVLAVLCLMLGLIGLIIPIIPGVLFLLGAVYLLSKVSRRVRRWSRQHRMYRGMETRFDRMGRVPIVDRVKVAGLMVTDVALRGLDSVVDRVSRMTRRRTA